MSLTGLGARSLFRGARRGNTPLAGFGAALLALSFVKRISRPRRELIYRRNLRRGETIRIRLLGVGDPVEGDSIDVVG